MIKPMLTLGEKAQWLSAVAAICAVIIAIMNMFEIKIVHISINSRMDQLLLERGKAQRLEGLQQGRDEKKK